MQLQDPVAIAMIVLLILMIPFAIILLTITARQSVESIFDEIRTERLYRRLQLSTRRSRLPTATSRLTHVSTPTGIGTMNFSSATPVRATRGQEAGGPVNSLSLKSRTWDPEPGLSRISERSAEEDISPPTSPSKTEMMSDGLVDHARLTETPPTVAIDLHRDLESYELIELKARLEGIYHD